MKEVASAAEIKTMGDESKAEEDPTFAGQFVCLAPKIGDLVIDYLIGELEPVDSAKFKNHLILCFKCQDLYFDFQIAFKTIGGGRAGAGRQRQKPCWE